MAGFAFLDGLTFDRSQLRCTDTARAWVHEHRYPAPNKYEQVLAKVQDRRDSRAQRRSDQIARVKRKPQQDPDGDR